MTQTSNRILIVEDSPTQRQRLRHILDREGFAVLEAGSGEEALDLLCRERPDLVISDIMMPGMDGYALCRRIKEIPELDGLPVILVTFLSEIRDVVRGLEAGADNFIMKPYAPDFLLSRVRRTLSVSDRRGTCSPSEFAVHLDEESYCIRSDRQTTVEILLSTYETALQRNEHLKAAQEELQGANQELEAFSYSVSHDLRTPLSVIAGFSELLWLDYASQFDEQGKKHLAMIRRATEKMNRLINDLLNLSRAARAEITRKKVDVTAMARSIAAELRKVEPARKVDIVIEEGMAAEGDEALLRIAIENLFRNAWKFTSKQEQARIEAGWEPGDSPVYYVRDNGAGFDMADRERLFASFQRLHSESEFPGTGLGLTIVQRVIARHGGRIWAEGRVNEGATFYFTVGS